jgi:hypothetical protein
VLVAHARNPNYSEGRDQEDCGLKPDPGKLFMKCYVKKKIIITKRAGGIAQVARLPE